MDARARHRNTSDRGTASLVRTPADRRASSIAPSATSTLRAASREHRRRREDEAQDSATRAARATRFGEHSSRHRQLGSPLPGRSSRSRHSNEDGEQQGEPLRRVDTTAERQRDRPACSPDCGRPRSSATPPPGTSAEQQTARQVALPPNERSARTLLVAERSP